MTDEEDRRRQEINLFAAMALGVDDELNRCDAPTDTEPRLSSESEPATDLDDLLPSSQEGEDSGTFQFATTPLHKNTDAERSLEAAAAALSDDPGHVPVPLASALPDLVHQPSPFVMHSAAAQQQVADENAPMFAEEVVMPRPLFFGAIVPPRVLREGRQIVLSAMEELGLERYDSVSLQELPESVRNLVGALRAYGFGLDDLFSDDELPDHGDSNVSTFQPVWGESVRGERIRDYRKQMIERPHPITRSSTAPPRLMAAFVAGTGESWDIAAQYDSSDSASNWVSGGARSVKSSARKANRPPLPGKRTVESLKADNDQFSAWLGDEDAQSMESHGTNVTSDSEDDIVRSASPSGKSGDTPPPMTEQELFSKWARGGDSSRDDTANSNKNTFKRLPSYSTALGTDDSDDDSVNYDELKKKVGLSDHLSKAIASLADDASQPPEAITLEETKTLLSQTPADLRTRPLSNFELTNGCVPLFGSDDTPLPVESDLGVHETREEQQRSNEQKRSQEIIEKLVGPNVFGCVACPSPALNPDDFHSWNSRSATSQRTHGSGFYTSDAGAAVSPKKSVGSIDSVGAVSDGALKNQLKAKGKKKRAASRTRYGWWNVEEKKLGSDRKEGDVARGETDEGDDLASALAEKPLHLPPLNHSSTVMQVVTTLEPTPRSLCEANLPLSRLHAATSMAQTLPYLSDRPPSHRYLQIDTQSVGFRPIGAEVEPLFCSLAIYNVETVSSGDSLVTAPVPDLQRCGRVTEALNFDVVSDEDVARRCSDVLWPYSRGALQHQYVANNRLLGTRCGVFPVPSNLGVANLYAVLIVRKVLSESVEIDPYLKPGHTPVDVEKLKTRAEKSSRRYGNFLVPFAFGVAPLLQVFGTENPVVASSRAVQIPLFRFLGSERNIIDHIMVMLYPRADHNASGIGGPAAVTNGGTAMLVMRNFGYLGLHKVVDRKSSLARDRLVDFTGELQLRVRDQDNEINTEHQNREGFKLKLPVWHPAFVAEPTVRGGRNCVDEDPQRHSQQSHLYAQELAPLPLQLAPSTTRVPSGIKPGGRLHGDDIEPFYHTSFCNELLFHPRLLHNCPKGNIVIKVEMREMEWQQDINGYFAHIPRVGPSIHNGRRGPFLVQSAFTSCSRGDDHHFIDEFKLKLPIDLKPRQGDGTPTTLALFFTVYNVKLGSKTKWQRAKKLLGTIGVGSVESDDQDRGGKRRLEQISCGFLPLTQHLSLIENGMHDVRIGFSARAPPPDLCKRGLVSSTTLIVMEGPSDSQNAATCSDAFVEDAMSMDSISDLITGSDIGGKTDGSLSELASLVEDSQLKGLQTKACANQEPISLSVRIVVHSSLHTQNETLTSFLNEEVDLPRLFQLPSQSLLTKLKMGRDFLSGVDFHIPVNVHPSENQLLELVIDVSKHQLCGVPQSSSHIWRILSLLWRLMICGSGEPDVIWANPASSLPLRVHAFATIMHLVGSTSMYLSKNGVTLVDGVSGWNVVTLGRVLALLFDERKLFGEQAVEILDDDLWFPREDTESRASGGLHSERRVHKRRHVRQTYDLFNDMPPRDNLGNVELLSFQAGTLHSPARSLRSTQSKTSESPEVPTASHSSDDVGGLSFHSADESRARKVDSKSDFQSAFRAATSGNDPDGFEGDGGKLARTLVQSFGGLQSGSRRFMTAPNRGLSTIREVEDVEDTDMLGHDEDRKLKTGLVAASETSSSNAEPSDDEFVLSVKSSVKQFRVPNRGRDKPKQPNDPVVLEKDSSDPVRVSVPKTDEEIESAGTAFLDVIGKSLGLSSNKEALAVEERCVGSSHHRKNHSRGTSIDWSLLSEVSPVVAAPGDSAPKEQSVVKEKSDESMSTLKTEESTSIRLPSFADRLITLAKKSLNTGRWQPYAYEVVIIQWCAILIAQRRSTEKSAGAGTAAEGVLAENEVLTHAAMRSVGVAVASAPMLFEVVKQSLGFRVLSLFRLAASRGCKRICPPLVILDETLMVNLEQVISMVTDACLDARNFDSWELRQLSIDVNDSVIRFLRDMFSFLAPANVHRLVLIYLGRFVTKEGKQWQDRDSSIGLRCSWEITKMRMNAVTALVRFPDFPRVNSPQMMNWKNWMGNGPHLNTPCYFDSLLEQYREFRLNEFVGGDEVDRKAIVEIPPMRPHWLAELVVDICLLGIVHAEQYIQHRSASLLHEVFWLSAQYGRLKCRIAPIGSMFVTFVEKVLSNVSYLANFAPKSQLRKDLLPCAIHVLESTPASLLHALWRKMIGRLPGKGSVSPFSLTSDLRNDCNPVNSIRGHVDTGNEENDILDVFSLLNLALKTIEYEGSEENLELDSSTDYRESIDLWRREYLLSLRSESSFRKVSATGSGPGATDEYSSSISRKWQAHDGSLVIINTTHQIVLELYSKLSSSAEDRTLLNPAIRRNRSVPRERQPEQAPSSSSVSQRISYDDVVLFVRAATSVYLQSLALRQSDIVIVRTFRVTAEAIKIFGIKMFLTAIGETLQHWMRVIFINCGARRAHVRVEATDLLELVLRSTWECFGSFFRIRVPLLAVQTEVMERIVATAAARYYRDQRRLGTSFEKFSHLNAEASLVPLWRTLDRIEKQPASQNIAFRGALIRMAEKLKKLYRAYVAARVLSFIQGPNAGENLQDTGETDLETESFVRARRINVMKVINASDGYSKQFLGFQGTGLVHNNLAHYEAVEDALIDAADIFSPTELPEHRVAWLQMLADFHRSRRRYAEEATCHFYIHTTLQQASLLHGSLWSNTPFLPWTDNIPDPVYICDWENPNTDPDYEPDLDLESNEGNFGRQVESANSFRRIFYRVANSVGMSSEEWDVGASKNLFCGVTYPFEYHSVTPWITLREMEEQMVEEAEAAGELFLAAGIVQSSRVAWNLATNYYAEKFNFAKLAIAYGNLARTVVTQVPIIDTTLPQEVSALLGRFYRVWFHGSAPDELTGVEFVYRSEGSVRLEQFGEELRNVIQSIVPDKTPIHLLLDGRSEERVEDGTLSYGFSRIGPAPLEPVRIKVTPLRPLSRTAARTRGRPEWFVRYVEEAFADQRHRTRNELNIRSSQRRGGSSHIDYAIDPHHRDHGRTFSATALSSGSSGVQTTTRRVGSMHFNQNNRVMRSDPLSLMELAGVDKFCFVQPKDRKKTSKEWWKSQNTDLAEKTLKVTQLQVAQPFPACVARQEVIHRVVFSQSPLEAGVDAICQWCALLFRTAIATTGQALLGEDNDPGIGTDAAKVVADCIHSSNVKEIGLALLQKNSNFSEGDSSTDFSLDYDRLTEDEIKKLRLKIARLVVVFIELLHLLIARNRDLLLDIIQERKKVPPGSEAPAPPPPSVGSQQGAYNRSLSFGVPDQRPSFAYAQSLPGRDTEREGVATSLRDGRGGKETISGGTVDSRPPQTYPSPLLESLHQRRARSVSDASLRVPRRGRSGDEQSVVSVGTRTDSAIAVQSELQRAFINLCKSLHPRVQSVMQDETPRWLKQCALDNYFSLGTYKLTKIPIAEELCFNAAENIAAANGGQFLNILGDPGHPRVPSEIDSPLNESVAGGSVHSVVSKGSYHASQKGPPQPPPPPPPPQPPTGGSGPTRL